LEKIVFYGTRGSSSLTSRKYIEFGGATTCVMLNLGDKHFMIDCGSGINNALEDLKNIDELYLFISHSHIDHISGIATLLSSFQDKKLHIYGKTFDVSVEESINRIMSQSLWPVRTNVYKNVDFHEVTGDIRIDDTVIKNMDSNHPGGCSLWRFEHSMDIIVTAFDFSHLDGYDEKLVDFAKGANVLIYDGNMTEEELRKKPNWGHSTPEDGCRIGEKIGCNDLYITHFGIFDDTYLTHWEERLQKDYPFVSFARTGLRQDELKKMIDIGTLLSIEKDNDQLLTKIVEASMDITGADGGTLYLLENNKLEFKVLINRSKKTHLIRKDAPLDLPSVSIDGKNACATSAREKKIINIHDCYAETEYDLSGILKYDSINNYHTKSVLVIPLEDEYNDVVGILQLINATNSSGKVISFKNQDEDVLKAIANQASMAISNSSYSQKINELLYGFVKVMSVGIDERTPYNANHTRNMVRFADNFFNYQEISNGKYKVDPKKRREVLISIWLHDIGKILTPIDIMNKDTRLGSLNQTLENRFERRELLLKLFLASGKISKDEYELMEKERCEQFEFINQINRVGFLTDELKAKLDEVYNKTYIEEDGSVCQVLSNDEHYQLSIVKGTLNKEERSVMEGHVSMTQKFLSQLNFPKYYDNIPVYAGNHHEFLNGSGYPNHLTEKDLPWPCRLITVCDIFEALIAKDRPYKKPMPIEKAFTILYEMADHGQLDSDIIKEFELSKAWEQEN